MCYVLNEYLPDCKNSILTSTERKNIGITIDMRKDTISSQDPIMVQKRAIMNSRFKDSKG